MVSSPSSDYAQRSKTKAWAGGTQTDEFSFGNHSWGPMVVPSGWAVFEGLLCSCDLTKWPKHIGTTLRVPLLFTFQIQILPPYPQLRFQVLVQNFEIQRKEQVGLSPLGCLAQQWVNLGIQNFTDLECLRVTECHLSPCRGGHSIQQGERVWPGSREGSWAVVGPSPGHFDHLCCDGLPPGRQCVALLPLHCKVL